MPALFAQAGSLPAGWNPGGADPGGGCIPDPASYDQIVESISGGKDSQAALHRTVLAASAAGAEDRVMTVFADLGSDDEWPGTAELAAEHAAFDGLRHEVVCREVTAADGRRVPQGQTGHIAERGRWPDAARRYCTSDLKRAPIHRLLTRIAAEHRAAGAGLLGAQAQDAEDPVLPAWTGRGVRRCGAMSRSPGPGRRCPRTPCSRVRRTLIGA